MEIVIIYLLVCAMNVFFLGVCVKSDIDDGKGFRLEQLFLYVLFAFVPIFNICTLAIAPLIAFPKAYDRINAFMNKVGSFEIIKAKK